MRITKDMAAPLPASSFFQVHANVMCLMLIPSVQNINAIEVRSRLYVSHDDGQEAVRAFFIQQSRGESREEVHRTP
jgi:hypothetical protein